MCSGCETFFVSTPEKLHHSWRDRYTPERLGGGERICIKLPPADEELKADLAPSIRAQALWQFWKNTYYLQLLPSHNAHYPYQALLFR
jgi:hypothetical protein